MKEHIIEFKDLTESKEFLKNKVPNFMIIFIYLILSILIIGLIWMWFSETDMMIKATGIVRPDKNVSTVINVNNGNIEKINYSDGKNVKKGDLLYIVDTNSLKLQKEITLKTEEDTKLKIEKLKRFEQSIKKEKNLFTEDEIEFYNRYMSYKLQKEQLNIDYTQAKRKHLQEESLGLKFTTKAKLNELKAKEKYAEINSNKNRSEALFTVKSEIIEKAK